MCTSGALPLNQSGLRKMVTDESILVDSVATNEGDEPDFPEVESGGALLPLTTALESLLFVAGEAVSLEQLAQVLGCSPAVIEHALEILAEQYRQSERGLRVQRRDGNFQLVSLPEAGPLVEQFLNLDLTTRLSGPALETLAVIAYRQPITRAQIEAVRGVDSAGVLRSLVQRGLIEERGRLETAGRPILYWVTDFFLQHFGLTDLSQLPPLAAPELDLLESTTQLANLATDKLD
jgi:segregation and condensation protein B